MNSMANRDRQFQAFITQCAANGLKYEFFDVHFSHKDESSLETNERIKRNGYQKAYWDFVEKAQDPTHRHHQTLQQMRRLNHTRGGEPKVTPFGVNIFGVLNKDAHKVMVRLAGIPFPETPHCLSYLSARQKWIDWWIRIIQKNVSEAVVTGIEAGSRVCTQGSPSTRPSRVPSQPASLTIASPTHPNCKQEVGNKD